MLKPNLIDMNQQDRGCQRFKTSGASEKLKGRRPERQTLLVRGSCRGGSALVDAQQHRFRKAADPQAA